MKQVLKIYVNGKFIQFLKKSEVRFINDFCKNGIVTVELVTLSPGMYKAAFKA